jgi:hypothetical protein
MCDRRVARPKNSQVSYRHQLFTIALRSAGIVPDYQASGTNSGARGPGRPAKDQRPTRAPAVLPGRRPPRRRSRGLAHPGPAFRSVSARITMVMRLHHGSGMTSLPRALGSGSRSFSVWGAGPVGAVAATWSIFMCGCGTANREPTNADSGTTDSACTLSAIWSENEISVAGDLCFGGGAGVFSCKLPTGGTTVGIYPTLEDAGAACQDECASDEFGVVCPGISAPSSCRFLLGISGAETPSLFACCPCATPVSLVGCPNCAGSTTP